MNEHNTYCNPDTESLFPDVEIQARAIDMQLKLHSSSARDWILEVLYCGPGENCGLTKRTPIGAKQAAAVMALFIAADGMEELEQPLYDIIGSSLGEVTGDFSPIP